MIALVTGATGFVGSYIVRQLLAEGKYSSIRAIRRSRTANPWIADIADKVEWHDADINDIFALEDAMYGCEHVYHAAAIVSFDPKRANIMIKNNIEGTANVVNTALTCGVQKFAYVSSIAALGRTKDRRVIDEQTKWENDPLNSNYAISKFYAEQEVWRGAAEGLNVVIINPAVVIGAFNWETGSPALIDKVAKGLRFYSMGATGFVDVRDVARSLTLLMQSNVVNERFVITAENTSYRDFFNKIADAFGLPRPTIAVTPLIAAIAWRVEWLRSLITGKPSIITRETAHSSAVQFEYPNTKFLKQFPDFQFITLEKTIQDTVEKYKSA